MVIAASARSYLANAAMTPEDMLEAGWIVPAGDALNRLVALEANVAALQANVAALQANVAAMQANVALIPGILQLLQQQQGNVVGGGGGNH